MKVVVGEEAPITESHSWVYPAQAYKDSSGANLP
jgi:hypothetical protein